MTNVLKAPRTATTLKVRSKSEYAISRSRDPYHELMLRLFQEEATAERGQKFLVIVEERQKRGDPLKASEWRELLVELKVSRSAFYAMRNKLLGAGMITNKGGEYRLSGIFSRDLMDMARWWWTAVLGNNLENL
ncbi:MAG TPA: hypothetical protein PLO30_03575 [Methanothrix soehngenii]|jgi:hypothetical protein|uniref:Uncharacterized protein n=2 Tax=root TaxID=1 RepID=F4BU20_METSG|nr:MULTISPECIES: hypothetical protein [Methanothrix]NYT08947.1 hypothetical protein [Methanosarcinales archaeon]OPX81768.1 MAG: hypothetical protein A4E43_00597 [Methanosaeta sp. PtaB.Bin005]AEB68218.1 conserved hypothetical protein [Methanothrix soehngenii GP6]MBP7067752.1 hypothetical protein [Methanothrix sp.]MDD3551152.1 hypothetical protein [Methanothrix soehngenii]